MSIELEHARWLWGFAALPVMWLLTMWSRPLHTVRAKLLCAILRSVVLALVILALARPIHTSWVRRNVPVCVVFVADKSLSVQPALQNDTDKQLAYEAAVRGVARIERIDFARTAWPAAEPAPPDRDGTNIELALERARGELPVDGVGVVVLFTDGRATAGDGIRAANRLRAQGAHVYVISAGKPSKKGPRIIGVEPPSTARLGQPAQFLVRVRSDYDSTVNLRLLDGKGTEADHLTTSLRGEGVFVLRHVPAEAGFENCRVLITDSGEVQDEQTIAVAPIYVDGPPKVLILDTLPDEARYLVDALKTTPLQIDVKYCLDAAPDYQNLVSYDVVVANDCAQLDESFQSNLLRYVEEAGGGVLFVGGNNVRTKLWHGSPLEKALPVEFLPQEIKVVEKASPVHVCFVLDKSGSMEAPLGVTAGGAVSKIDMVKAAVQRSVAELPPNTTVSVVVFDATTTVLVRSAKVSEWDKVTDAIDHLAADGGTIMDTAVEMGIDLLAQSGAQRHMILLTDGITQTAGAGSPEARWEDLIGRIRQERIRLTTIALGAEADRMLLNRLTGRAGGLNYDCDTADQVPTVFVREAQTIKQLSYSHGGPFRPQRGNAAYMIRGISIDSMPLLANCVPVRQKELSQTVLVTKDNQPLLAVWQYGLGTVAAFAADAKPNWAREWIAWGSFGRFWEQVVSWVLRSSNRIHADVTPIVDGAELRVLMKVRDRDEAAIEHLQAVGQAYPVSDANADTAIVSWRQIQPAVYEGRAQLVTPGNHLCRVQLKQNGTTVFSHTMSIRAADPAESTETGPDAEALQAIAVSGGGRLDLPPSEVAQLLYEENHRTVSTTKEYWPFLVLAAVVTWVLDVTSRRIAAAGSPPIA